MIEDFSLSLKTGVEGDKTQPIFDLLVIVDTFFPILEKNIKKQKLLF